MRLPIEDCKKSYMKSSKKIFTRTGELKTKHTQLLLGEYKR